MALDLAGGLHFAGARKKLKTTSKMQKILNIYKMGINFY
jgi:hypothetical protein